MSGDDTRFFYDFIDPLSYFLAREVEALADDLGRSVTWQPFELRPPPTPLISVDDPFLAERWEAARRVSGGRGAGFDTPRLVPWTRKAHELVLHAAEDGRDGVIRMPIFEAYLFEGRDIGRVDVLVELAAARGFDTTETKAVLDVDRYEARVTSIRGDALSDGVATSPTIVRGDRRLEGFHNRDVLGTFLGT